jgi:ParB family transcriptional regulator, chromosome partitioning protein
MAKRKRLTPPQPDFLAAAPSPSPSPAPPPPEPADPWDGPAPETKSFAPGAPRMGSYAGPAPGTTRAPIAQVAGDTAAAAALDEVTQALSAARAEGRLALSLPLEEIDTGHLVRDRISPDSPELDELIASLRARGQRTAIEVVDLGEGRAGGPRYGLISGWRRLTALKRLAAEDPRFARVAAIVRAPEGAAEAYLAMVEENEIRLGLSYYERARIVAKALEEGVFETERAALQGLFAHVSRAKRSKIKSVMAVVAALDGALRFPEALTERQGLELAKACDDPATAARLRQALEAAAAHGGPETPEAEARLLAEARASAPPPVRTGGGAGGAPDPKPARAQVYFHFTGTTLTISGPGMDEDLADDLALWLERRGNFTPRDRARW